MVRLKQLLAGLGLAAVCTALGYFCGLVRGEGNELLLAGCFGAAGALAGLLGYGSVAGIFLVLPRLFGHGPSSSHQQENEEKNKPA